MNARFQMDGKLPQVQDWGSLARQLNWSVANLAKRCGVCTRTLERYFQETYHQTPEAWLSVMRCGQALELLREGAGVKSTAAELGYQQASTFSREFKKRFGQSPGAFANAPVLKSLPPRNVA